VTTAGGHSLLITGFLRFTAWPICVLMLLSFPLQIGTHDFNEHLRNPRICPSIVHHTSLERSEASGVDRLSAEEAVRMHVLLGEAERKAPSLRPQIASFIPLTRLFLRLKLGPSPSSSPDPLI
jgi:hypothetical protein